MYCCCAWEDIRDSLPQDYGVDYAATAAIGLASSEDFYEGRANLGDGSPMIGAEPTASVADETGYLTNDRLGGNS